MGLASAASLRLVFSRALGGSFTSALIRWCTVVRERSRVSICGALQREQWMAGAPFRYTKGLVHSWHSITTSEIWHASHDVMGDACMMCSLRMHPGHSTCAAMRSTGRFTVEQRKHCTNLLSSSNDSAEMHTEHKPWAWRLGCNRGNNAWAKAEAVAEADEADKDEEAEEPAEGEEE